MMHIDFSISLCNPIASICNAQSANRRITTVMKLRYNPYQIFRRSKSPAGLYARQKWLGESETSRWKTDYQEAVTALLANQLPDGSWNHAAVTTVYRCFGLHLTVRSSNDQINAALNWLLDKIEIREGKIHTSGANISPEPDLTGLPFIPSRPNMLLTGATLFLAAIFGRENDPDVLAIYDWLNVQGVKNKGRWFNEASSHNILRAMVVHPIFAKDQATALAVKYLAGLQSDNGDWGPHFPFYQTINALAHLIGSAVDTQLDKAFKWLLENQNSDGTWSRYDPEWNTFLAIHAMKNKGVLSYNRNN